MDERPRHIVVTGLMGVGKSTTGRALAEQIGWPYVDSDEDIEDLLGFSGRDLAEQDGIDALHRLEVAVLLGALVRREPHVIGAAAFVVEDDLVTRALRRHAFVVRLELSIAKTLERQAAGNHRRPMDSDELAALARRREPMFAAVEDLRVDANEPVPDLVATIIDAFRFPLSKDSG